jgi:DNA-binding beta-propeller fold protein YncE
MRNLPIYILTAFLLNFNAVKSQESNRKSNDFRYTIPCDTLYCKINVNGNSVLPSGRIVTPVGEKVRISRSPFGMCVNETQTTSVVIHNNALSVIDLTAAPIRANRMPSFDGKGLDVIKGASFIGATFLNDQKTVLVSGGDKGIIWFFNTEQRTVADSINCNDFHTEKGECFITDLCLDPRKNQLWALDRAWKVVYRIDLRTKKLISKIEVGRIPFGISISDDGKHVIVVNVGVYDYPLINGVTKSNKDSMFLHFPPYAAGTKESEFGVEIDGRKIQGLGDINSEESMSAYIDDIEVVEGSHPNSIVCDGDFAYITQSQLDEVAVINLKTAKLHSRIPIKTHSFLDSFKGYFPFGIDIDKKNKRLFVGLLGYNALSVIDLKSKKQSFIPGGWGVSRVKYLNKTNEVIFTSIRGFGAGPNGGKGFVTPPQGKYIGDIQLGLFQKVYLGDQKWLDSCSKVCLNNTFKKEKVQPNSSFDSVKNKIKHIVYITKENRTFDEVFAQLKGVRGDSTLSRFGVRAESHLKDQLLAIPNLELSKYGFDTLQKQRVLNSLDNLKVAPNHIKIAENFTVLDNFYCDSDASIHGHHWMMGTIPNEYVETNSANSGSFHLFSNAKGRRFPRTTGAQDPEDYNLIGGLWEALDRNKISVYNFGEANEYTDVQEEWYDTLNGTALPVAFPMPKAIFSKTSRNYAGYNTNIPDQFRVEQFEDEFTKLWLNSNQTLPEILTIQLPNDHTSSPRPADGYPFVQSYVADNDLALGRMLQFLSHTKYWENMLVIVTEDDPQGGVDHIDAHRSLLFFAGPFVKRKYVSHKHANFGSIIKLIYQLKGIHPVNQFDASASLLDDIFTTTPNFSPYLFEPSDNRVFDPNVAMKKYNKSIPWREVKMSEQMDNEKEIQLQFRNEK